ncbi:8382_t:CDS:2 [Funneliformis caledonium]|uniref:8382_t:CDS:1 n=1 Tax=Funneliformis caledonium TaxID=1117310 RepID=A0A9N8VCJ3_9GLOM|nr:8382_t:CDS:2 [Funneliformis caledonium]
MSQKGRNITKPNFLEVYKESSSRNNDKEIRDWSVHEVNEYLQTHLKESWTSREVKIFEENKMSGLYLLHTNFWDLKQMKLPEEIVDQI